MMKIKLFVLATLLLTTVSYASEGDVTVLSSGLQLIKHATLLKPVDAKKTISFVVWLKLRNKKELDQLAQDVYDPHSPRYHQFLTSSRYEKEFAPTRDAEVAVQKFFISHGMQATIVHHSIRVTGSAEQIEQALHIKINYYQYKNESVYSSENAPKLNAELAGYISEITGLSAIPEFHANAVSPNSTPHVLNFLWNSFFPKATPTDISLQGFSGANLQKAYNLVNISPINGVHLNGAGQTLVIVDKCGSNGPAAILSDANQYFSLNNISRFIVSGPAANFAVVNPDGTPFTTCPGTPSFSQEILLDVESSHTIAPGDNTVLVLGADQKTTLIDTISTLTQQSFTIAGFSNAYVISNSWSDPETVPDIALDNELQIAASSGLSINFSSGDCGDNTYSTASKCGGTPSTKGVDYPSSSIYVTAVGATALFVDANYRYAFETVWGKVKLVGGTYSYEGGTGGGVSSFSAFPSWQSSIGSFTAGGYGVVNKYVRRALPDVAMLGDPQTGLLIISNGQQVQDGGTSLACPLFSATLVLVNQARNLLNKGTPIGQAAPYLYQNNQLLLSNRAINLIVPPSVIISGATPPPITTIQGTTTPASAFSIGNVTYGWDSSLTVEPEVQFWNDAVGVGSPNIPNFISTMANL